MSKFYVGQKVRVLDSSGCCGNNIPPVGFVGTIAIIDSDFTVKLEEYNAPGNWLGFDRIEPITETPETLTINGVEYIRKPEPVVEHEWKFGDVAVHEDYGVGIVAKELDRAGRVYFFNNGGENAGFVKPSSLTFIRRADLSV